MSVTNAPPTSAHAIRSIPAGGGVYHRCHTTPPDLKHVVQGGGGSSPSSASSPTPFTNLDAALCSWSAAPAACEGFVSPYYGHAASPPPPPSSFDPPPRSATPAPAMPKPLAPGCCSTPSPYPSPLVRAKANVAAMAIRNLSVSAAEREGGRRRPRGPGRGASDTVVTLGRLAGEEGEGGGGGEGKEEEEAGGGGEEEVVVNGAREVLPPGLKGERGFVDRRVGGGGGGGGARRHHGGRAGGPPGAAMMVMRALERRRSESGYRMQCAACGRCRPERSRFCCSWPPLHLLLFTTGGLAGGSGRRSTR